MCLIPDDIIPKKFKVNEFIKYNDTQFPMIRLHVYCNKIAEVVYEKRLLI
jgi:hypothetical protein